MPGNVFIKTAILSRNPPLFLKVNMKTYCLNTREAHLIISALHSRCLASKISVASESQDKSKEAWDTALCE
jgi:hypothetical protein